MKKKYVTFNLGNELYGFEIMRVKEICKVHQIVTLPNLPPMIRGIFKLRNKLVPVVDMRKRFRFDTEYKSNTVAILNIETVEVGVLIDNVKQVAEIDDAFIQPPPILNTGIDKEYLLGIAKINDTTIVIIVNIDKMFSPEEIANLIKIKHE